jgi:hypothetical protein
MAQNRALSVVALMLVSPALMAANTASLSCDNGAGCRPVTELCSQTEHFGGFAEHADLSDTVTTDDCLNSLVISTDSAAVGFGPAAPTINAPSAVKENAWFIAAEPGIQATSPIAPGAEGAGETAYVPLTPQQKFQIFARSTHDPSTFVSAGFDAALSQISGDSRPYGGGVEGYGKRYGAALADTESSVFFSRFLFPVIYRQDPRYFRLGHGTLFERARYAVTRVFITRKDDGRDTLNLSHFTGRFTSNALSNLYYPINKRGVLPTMRRTANGLLSDAGGYLFKEFWPDLRRKLLPQRFQKMANRISALTQK